MTSPISTLLLDYGGIYAFEYDPRSWNTALSEALGIALDRLSQVDLRDLDSAIGTGEMTTDTYLSKVAVRLDHGKMYSDEIFRSLTSNSVA